MAARSPGACVKNSTRPWMRGRHHGSLALVGLLALLVAGCGQKKLQRVAVGGRVSYDGKAIVAGTFAFLPTDGTKGPSSGGEIKFGVFEIPADKGPIMGTHRVEIRASRPTGEKVMDTLGSGGGEGKMVSKMEMYVPAMYNVNSNLKVTLEEDTNDLAFDLLSPKDQAVEAAAAKTK